ncbi:uncharacterized protein METZ01_LOCUS350419, partial [marine metagenome]
MPFVNQSRNMGGSLVTPETLGGGESTYGNYKVHTFLQSGQFTYIASGTDVITADVLTVAGGGGGGGNHGGGGAGGMVEQTLTAITPGIYN